MALPSFLGSAIPEQPQSCTGHLKKVPMAESRETGEEKTDVGAPPARAPLPPLCLSSRSCEHLGARSPGLRGAAWRCLWEGRRTHFLGL